MTTGTGKGSARARRATSAIIVAALALVAPRFSRADVVPPPSVKCAANERVQVDHGGGHCEAVSCPPGKVLAPNPRGWMACLEPPPKSCPAGWGPVPGATCQLARCDDATPCANGTECRATPVCTRDGQGFGMKDEAPARSLFAAPMAPRPSREYLGACDTKNACGSIGQECRSVRVCLPPGVDRVAPRPTNGRSVTSYASHGGRPADEAPLPGDTAPPSGSSSSAAPPSAQPPSTPPSAPSAQPVPVRSEPVPPQSGRGGAGCAVTVPSRGRAELGVLAAATLAAGFAARRRRPR